MKQVEEKKQLQNTEESRKPESTTMDSLNNQGKRMFYFD